MIKWLKGAMTAPPKRGTDLTQVYRDFIYNREGGEGEEARGSFTRTPFSNHSMTYTCMSIIAQAMASVPYMMAKKESDENGNPIVVKDHPLQDLLNDPFPGVYADFCQFIETIALYLEASGNAWVLPDAGNSRGIPRSLMVLGRQHVSPVIDGKTGRLIAWKLKIAQIEEQVSPDALIHMKYTNPDSRDQILGIGPMQAAMQAINADFARQTYDGAFFRNGARPSLALVYTPPDTRPEEQFLPKAQIDQVREAFHDNYGGVKNAHKVAIVHGGFQIQELSISQKDMDFIEGRRWSRQEIAAVFRVPVPLLNDFQHAGLGREGVAVAQRMLYENNIVPKVQRLTSVFQKFLIDRYAPGHIAGFNVGEIPAMREDMGEKADIAYKFFQMGWPINEINKVLKLGFQPVPWGDDWLVDLNLIPARQIAGPEAMTVQLLGLNTTADSNIEDAVTAGDTPQVEDKSGKTDQKQLEDKTKRSVRKDRAARNVQHRNAILKVLDVEMAYRKRVHRFIYELRRETLQNIETFYAKQQRGVTTRSILDDLLSGMMFNLPQARQAIQDFSRSYFEKAAQRAAAGAVEVLADNPTEIGLSSPTLRVFLNQRVTNLRNIPDAIAQQVTFVVRDALNESLTLGENLNEQATRITDAAQDVFNFSASSSRRIARTEIMSVFNGTRVNEFKEQGVEEQEWLSSQDEVVRGNEPNARFDHTIDGETVVIGDLFSNGLEYPGDPNGEAANVISCRCTVLPVVRGNDGEALD